MYFKSQHTQTTVNATPAVKEIRPNPLQSRYFVRVREGVRRKCGTWSIAGKIRAKRRRGSIFLEASTRDCWGKSTHIQAYVSQRRVQPNQRRKRIKRGWKTKNKKKRCCGMPRSLANIFWLTWARLLYAVVCADLIINEDEKVVEEEEKEATPSGHIFL